MADIWFISDTHFNHARSLEFKRLDGSPMRPEFQSAKEMDDKMFENWNKVVKQYDKVYHLGDLRFGRDASFDNRFKALPGRKRLCLGNHDEINHRFPVEAFEKIMLWRNFDDFTATHVPLRPDSFRRNICVHGHLHEKNVLDQWGKPDPAYISVCVEQPHINYTPIHIDEVNKMVNQRKKILKIDK